MSSPDAHSDTNAKQENVTKNALNSRGMAGAAALVMIFFVLSRATGLLREMIIGAQFGTGAELDAYLAAFAIAGGLTLVTFDDGFSGIAGLELTLLG